MSTVRLRRPPSTGPRSRVADLPGWIARSPELQALQRRADDAALLWREASALLPPALAAAVEPGAPADGSWPLLAGSSAVAAKLKLFAPALLQQLRARGWAIDRIAVRVRPRRGLAPRPAAPPLRPSQASPAVRLALSRLRARWQTD